MLTHPQFDPIALALGPVAIRWYGLMYVVAFVLFMVLGRMHMKRRPDMGFSKESLDDLLFYGMLGVILGGRLGYVIFYKPMYSDIFAKSGLKAPVLDNIRNEIWLKLWGNLTFNPISGLTHATLQDICEFPLGRELATNMMREAQAVGEKLGTTFRVTLEKRIDGAAKVGKHKTSMQQDVEAGRAIEIDALVGSVVELGVLTGVPTPTITAIYQASKLLPHTIETEKIAVRGIGIPQV